MAHIEAITEGITFVEADDLAERLQVGDGKFNNCGEYLMNLYLLYLTLF